MTLKDWKKTWHNRYTNKKRKTDIHYIQSNPIAMKKDFKKPYKYIFYDEKGNWKYFLNKISLIRYMESYMRKH